MNELREGVDIWIRWFLAFYDGPVTGIAEHEGRKVWFDCRNGRGDWDMYCRTYRVFALTDEQIAREVERHAEFDRCVGTHTNCVYEGVRRRRVDREPLQPNWRDWYAQPHEAIARTEYNANPIGWFSRSPHNRRPRSRRYFERRDQMAAA